MGHLEGRGAGMGDPKVIIHTCATIRQVLQFILFFFILENNELHIFYTSP